MTQQYSPPREVVEMSRRILENVISSSLNTADTTGTCMYGSILVSMLLEKFSGSGRVSPVGMVLVMAE
jgi:hypothetical protein